MTANRILRVRKILSYVAGKLESVQGDASIPISSKRKAEEWLELVCNEQVLDVTLTLATVRVFIWKSNTDIQFHFQPKNYATSDRIHGAT